MATADPHRFAIRPAPALAVRTSKGHGDSVSFRFELSGPVTCHTETLPPMTLPPMPVSAIAVEPCETGVLVDYRVDDGSGRTFVVDTPLTLQLAEPTAGTIDGHPQLFPAGTYTITGRPRSFHRVVDNEP